MNFGDVCQAPYLLIIRPTAPVVERAFALFPEKNKGECLAVDSVEMAVQQVALSPTCLVVLSFLQVSDGPICMSFLKQVQAFSGKHQLRSLFIANEDKKIINLLMSLGASEVLSPKISPTSLTFKFGLQLNLLSKGVQAVDSSMINVKSGSSAKENETVVVSGSSLAEASSLQSVAEDIWFLKGEVPKKVAVQWVLDVTGPDPDSGAWEFAGMNGRLEQWRWKSNDGSPDEGWVFTGQCPVYSIETNKWKLVSKKPELIFTKPGQGIFSKIRTDGDKGIIFGADSPSVQGNLERLRKIGDTVRQRKAAQEHKQSEASHPTTAAVKANENKRPGVPPSTTQSSNAAPASKMQRRQAGDQANTKSPAYLPAIPGSKAVEGKIAGQNPTSSRPASSKPSPENKAQVSQATQQKGKDSAGMAPVIDMASRRKRKKSSQPSKVGFFVQVSDLVASQQSETEVYQWMVSEVKNILNVEHVSILKLFDTGRTVRVLGSTNSATPAGQIIEVAQTHLKEAHTWLREQVVPLNEQTGVLVYPLGSKIGEVMAGYFEIYFKKNDQEQLKRNIKFINQVSKQLTKMCA